MQFWKKWDYSSNWCFKYKGIIMSIQLYTFWNRDILLVFLKSGHLVDSCNQDILWTEIRTSCAIRTSCVITSSIYAYVFGPEIKSSSSISTNGESEGKVHNSRGAIKYYFCGVLQKFWSTPCLWPYERCPDFRRLISLCAYLKVPE